MTNHKPASVAICWRQLRKRVRRDVEKAGQVESRSGTVGGDDLKTSRFTLTIGVNPGYSHNNEVIDAVAVVARNWNELATKVSCGVLPYVQATCVIAKHVYSTACGCPDGGEDVVIVTGVRQIAVDQSQWKNAVLTIASLLRKRLGQDAAYIEFDDIDLVVITD